MKNRKKDVVRVHYRVAEGWWDLDTIPQKIFLTAMMFYDEKKSFVEFSRAELKQVASVDITNLRAEHRKKIYDEIFNARIWIKEDKRMKGGPIVTFVEEANGYIILKFNEDLQKYIVEARKKLFVRFRMKAIARLRRKYSIRMYMLLRKYMHLMFAEFSIEEIRRKFLFGNDTYKRATDIIKYVLKPAVSEINEKTDLGVNYELKRVGRKIVSVKFNIISRKTLLQAAQQAHLKVEDIRTLDFENCIITLPDRRVKKVNTQKFLRETASLTAALKKTK